MFISQGITWLAPPHNRVSRVRPGGTLVFSFASQKIEENRVVVETYSFGLFGVKNLLEYLSRFLTGEENILIGSCFEVVARGDHGSLYPHVGHCMEQLLQVLHVAYPGI